MKILILIYCILAFYYGLVSSEECVSYCRNGKLQRSISCSDYCCGNCLNRTCCEDRSERLSQKNCQNNYYCSPYYNFPISAYMMYMSVSIVLFILLILVTTCMCKRKPRRRVLNYPETEAERRNYELTETAFRDTNLGTPPPPYMITGTLTNTLEQPPEYKDFQSTKIANTAV